MKWVAAVVRAQVRRRLSAWPNRRIGTHDEDDLVSQILIALLERDARELRRFDPSRGRATPFLRNFSIQRIVELERKELHRRALAEGRPEPIDAPPPNSPHDWYAYIEQRDRLIGHLRTAASRQDQEIFFWAFVEHLSNPETGEKVGLTADQVATRIFELRRRVREFLEDLNGSNPKEPKK